MLLFLSFVVAVVFVVLFVGFMRSNGFLVEVENEVCFDGFDVEFSFLNLVVELELTLVWFLEELRLLWNLEELRLLDLTVLVELLLNLMVFVWYFMGMVLDLIGLVWFLEEKLLGLLSLVWFLVNCAVVFFFKGCSSFSTSSILLVLIDNCVLVLSCGSDQ